MTWVDIFEKVINALTNPTTIGAVVAGWFGVRTIKAGNLNKEQFHELKNELGTIQNAVETVQDLGHSNGEILADVNKKLLVHDEAHLVTMYLRLERDMTNAINRGYTTVHESDVIHKMHKSYKNLGGNGYIDSLYQKYNILEVRN
jgi:putative uncharacterized protein orf5|nr:MAG TPA: hypothetical protein [Caudoviricetes sp.]